MIREYEESEKWLERHLTRLTKGAGGLSLKFASATQTGYPDRILLFPTGRIVFVELKSSGRKPTKLQEAQIGRLRGLGFEVRVCDSREAIEEIFDQRQGGRDPQPHVAEHRTRASEGTTDYRLKTKD